MNNELGLVQVYTGDGKGKTTASIGLAIRAVGRGFKVLMIQFMKGDTEYGEINAAKDIEGFDIVQFGTPDFVDKENPKQIDIDEAQKALAFAKDKFEEGKYDIIILDEVNVALEWNLIKVEDVVKLVKEKPEKLELILTGRYAKPEIIELADLVSEVKEVKHPYQKGTMARDGVEH